jgi:hypothetical protein
MSVLALATRCDLAAKTAADWCRGAFPPGSTIIEGADCIVGAIRSAVAGGALKVCYVGHGDPERWFRKLREGRLTVLGIPDASSVSGAGVLSIACESGSRLGRAMVEAGAVGFGGFKTVLAWNPGERQTETAVGNCVRELAQSFFAAPQVPYTQSFRVIVEEHWTYWQDLLSCQDETAKKVVGYLGPLRSGLVCLS